MIMTMAGTTTATKNILIKSIARNMATTFKQVQKTIFIAYSK